MLALLANLALTASPLAAWAQAAPVKLDAGWVAGTQAGEIRVFRSIPYAAPPLGALRWRPPQPVAPWAGVRTAATFGPACPQIGNYPVDAVQQPTSEDCLTLNVWTPASRGTASLPVMVWIHGGGLVNGSGSVPNYSGDRLARHGVIVVTLNYRLGALGFLSHPELNRESPQGTSGNYGLLDQIATLQWVRRNIAAFGGDPRQVTVFGQSSGAFSVSMLVASPLAKGLFRRAIAQSGGVFEPVELDPGFTPQGAAEAGQRFARRAGAATLAELRRLPVETVLKTPFNPQFNVDGHVLPAAPHDAYVAGRQNSVDLLLGSSAAEGSFFLDPAKITTGNFNDLLEQTYPSLLLRAVGAAPGQSDADARRDALEIDSALRFGWDMWAWANLAARSGAGRTFLYRFTAAPNYRRGHPLHELGATHGGELPYVFGQLDPRAADWTSSDRVLSEMIERYWTNFARTGNPNGPGLPSWPQFAVGKDQAFELNHKLRVIDLPDAARLHRIDRVYAAARLISRHPWLVLALSGGLVTLLVIWLPLRWLRRRRARARINPA